VVPAEWGGWYNSEKDCTWHNCMVDFMTQNGLHGSFYSVRTSHGLPESHHITIN
jgi:hypothetical protein